jgi:hypothetical protein
MEKNFKKVEFKVQGGCFYKVKELVKLQCGSIIIKMKRARLGKFPLRWSVGAALFCWAAIGAVRRL